ncbi:MAG: sensor histidine kinase [Nitrosarchaeum sp.]|nr:sensor histidine kinase [Nitrosarchaeum sp.]
MASNLLKISFVIIAIMFSISLTFTVFGLVTFDLSVNEIKKLLGVRNENFAYNMMQGLDNHIEDRISNFEELTNLNLVHAALLESNQEFEKIPNFDQYLNTKEQIEITNTDRFIESLNNEMLTNELVDTIEFYRDEYDYDVIQEIIVTNAYGIGITLLSETSDYLQSDEEWWQTAKTSGKYTGKIRFNENSQSYLMDFAFRVNDVNGKFIGVLQISVSLDDLVEGFIDESELLVTAGRNAMLLDERGHVVVSDGKIFISNSTVPYFVDIVNGKDTGYFELEDDIDNFHLISYAKSTGYRTFEGFDWITIVAQDASTIVGEFEELRQSILLGSVIGMISSVIGGLLISTTITSPLKNLTKIAKSISQGKFDVSIKKSGIDEIKTISNSFEEMIDNIKKLIDMERKLAEAHVKIRNERLTTIGEIASSMAHNMKNPLGIVKSSADILQRTNKQNPELNEVVNRMNRAIDRISHQIDDVLNYVRITPLQKEVIKISELLQIAKKSLEIPDNISVFIPDSDIEIKCDVRKMEIVFINIFLNAVQSIGNNVGEIRCNIQQKESIVTIEIQDSGPGIPDNILPKIFHPLITSKQKGTGLGLSTCKHVVEQHDGSISVQNNPTRFTITLPISED